MLMLFVKGSLSSDLNFQIKYINLYLYIPILHLRFYPNSENTKPNDYVNSEWRVVKTIIYVRGRKKHSLNLITQVEFATLEIRKTKLLTFMLENIDMDIILRITMEPQLVNLIFIFVIITTSKHILMCLVSYQKIINNKEFTTIYYLSPISLHFSLYLSLLSCFYNKID